MKYTIDAKGESLGRIASRVALLLLGKDTPEYRKNLESENEVLIVNADGIKISPKKMDSKTHSRYSGYPSGLKKTKISKTIESKGIEEVIRLAVYGMLPANKTRKNLMKKIKIES